MLKKIQWEQKKDAKQNELWAWDAVKLECAGYLKGHKNELKQEATTVKKGISRKPTVKVTKPKPNTIFCDKIQEMCDFVGKDI